MKVGDKVRVPKRGEPIGEIVKEIPKCNPSDKRLFEILYLRWNGKMAVATYWIDEIELIKQT